ncbi:MAG: hypothetical protein M3Q57_05625 [Pseudomonadota bacterium]|nr:hypothetical protein [Pseudomonadota bacterium]
MDNVSRSFLRRASAGIAVALVIGVAVIATCNTIWAIARNYPMLSLWDEASISQIVKVSAPFVLLALFGIKSSRPWIVGLCLTGAFWGFYTYDITRPYEGGGANIGLGILMMFSPIAIIGASLLSLVTLRGRSAGK